MSKAVKKAERKISAEAGLMAGSHYFQTLADPFNVHGEKVPDDITHPSSTFTIVDRRVLTLNASGFGTIVYGLAGGPSGQVFGSMVPCRLVESFATDPKDKKFLTTDRPPSSQVKDNSDGSFKPKDPGVDTPAVYSEKAWYVGTVTTAAGTQSAASVLPSEAGGSQAPFKFAQWDTGVGVPTLYSKARLVSAGFTIDYLGTTLNAKGRITAASVPRRTLRQNQASQPTTLTQIQNLVGAQIVPVNKLKGVTLVYHPTDPIDYVYTDLESAYDATSLTHHDEDCALGNEFWCVVDGAEASATCQITGVFNYEAIPKLGTLNLVQPTYSRTDPIELAMTQNAIQKVPTAMVGNQAARSLETGKTQLPAVSAPESSTLHSTEEQREEKEEESFMTKVLDGAEGLASNFASAPGPLGIVGKAAPLARKALSFLGI